MCLNERQKCKQYTGTVVLPWRSPEMRSQNPTGNIWQTTITHWSSECKHHLPEEAAQTSVRPSLPVIYYWGASPDLSTALTPTPQPWHWRIHLCTGTRRLQLFDLRLYLSWGCSVEGKLKKKKTLRPVVKCGLIKLKSGHCCRFTVFVNNYPVLGVADWLERFTPHIGVKAVHTLKLITGQRQTTAHTHDYMDNSEMPINLQCMSLDWGRKPGRHGKSVQTPHRCTTVPPTLYTEQGWAI